MAKQPDTAWDNADGSTVFQVTFKQVVGEVVVDPHGTGPSPHAAAFALIANNDTEGMYEFPMWNGQTCIVTVEYDGEPR